MGTRIKTKKSIKKAGRPEKRSPEYPMKSIRNIDPIVFMDFKHWAERQGKNVGEAISEIMKVKLYEVRQEDLELQAENIRGR